MWEARSASLRARFRHRVDRASEVRASAQRNTRSLAQAIAGGHDPRPQGPRSAPARRRLHRLSPGSPGRGGAGFPGTGRQASAEPGGPARPAGRPACFGSRGRGGRSGGRLATGLATPPRRSRSCPGAAAESQGPGVRPARPPACPPDRRSADGGRDRGGDAADTQFLRQARCTQAAHRLRPGDLVGARRLRRHENSPKHHPPADGPIRRRPAVRHRPCREPLRRGGLRIPGWPQVPGRT